MGKVLVTDGNQRSALALTRSLGRKGVEVTVGEERLPCLAATSKYCTDSFAYTAPTTDPEGMIDDLKKQLDGGNYDLLIPMTDITSHLVAKHYHELSTYTKIAMPQPETYRSASDKTEMMHRARQLGVPIPQTYFVESIDEAISLAPDLTYPIVLKPRQSRYLTDSGWALTRVAYANNPEQLIAAIKKHDPSLPLPMLQERITGPGCGAFLLFDHGTEKAVFFHRRLREKPPSGGVSVLRESIPIDSKMKDDATRLLKSLNWHGVAMVEFKQDNRDNQYKLMEINARFWGSLQLAIDAGVDFPHLLYRMETESSLAAVNSYRTGVRSRWFLGDLDHLLARLFKSANRLNLPNGAPGRLRTMFDLLKLKHVSTRYEIIDRDDPAPARHEFAEWVKALFRAH